MASAFRCPLFTLVLFRRARWAETWFAGCEPIEVPQLLGRVLGRAQLVQHFIQRGHGGLCSNAGDGDGSGSGGESRTLSRILAHEQAHGEGSVETVTGCGSVHGAYRKWLDRCQAAVGRS